MPRKKKSKAEIEQTPLTTEQQFRAAMGKMVTTTKAKSDKLLAAFQASNKARRDARSER